MSDTLPTRRKRRATILAALALAAAVAIGWATWLVQHPAARQLFKQGLLTGPQDPTAGERLFRRAIQAAGGRYPDAQLALCDALARQGAWDRALSEFSSVEIGECRDDLLLAFGRDALEAERKSAGVQALQAVSRRGSPASVTALGWLQAAYHESGQRDEERAAAYELARLEPDNPEHWKRLLDLLEAERKMAECEETVREALQQDFPEEYRHNFEYMLIRLLVARGEVAESRRRIADLKEVEGQSFRLSTTEIDLCRLEGRWDSARKLVANLSPDARNLPVMYHLRGVVHFDLEEYEDAARDLERAVALRPFSERVHFKLSEAYRLLKRGELAAQHAEIAAAIAAKRKRINDLIDESRLHPHDGAIVNEIVALHQELGESNAAHDWQKRTQRKSQVPPDSH